MPRVVIENPILNGPFNEPGRHFRFDDDGITDHIVDERRISTYFVPIAKPKKKGKQLVLDTEWTQADEPYEKLKRALRADIDEAAWSALYSTTSQSFPPPTTGRIAVKVINHYGDEVLKVYTVK